MRPWSKKGVLSKENSVEEGDFWPSVRKKRSAGKDAIEQKMMRKEACESKYYHIKISDMKGFS